MYFIDQINLVSQFTKLIFCIGQNKAPLGSQYSPTFEQYFGILFQLDIIIFLNNTPTEYISTGNILIMPNSCFGSRCDNRLRQRIIFAEAIGKLLTTQFPFTYPIFTPRMTGKVSADDHLHLKRLA